MRETFVYFLRRADGEGPVKIGCSHWPVGRLATMMAWSPYPLALVATIPGDGKLELRFHALLGSAWSHGEWFHPTPAALGVLERVAAGTFDLAELPAKGVRHSRPRTASDRKWTDGMKYENRLRRLLYRSGIHETRDVEAAAKTFDQLAGAERDAARELIEAHLREPLARGYLFDAPWAIREYAVWAKKHGAPPLTISKAA